MRKKFLAALVAALMLMACVPFISGCSASVNYVLSEDGSHYIASCSGYKSALKGELVIAEDYNGLPVTEIAQEGFRGAGISRLTVPAAITKIGMAAFANCNSLREVEFKGTALDIAQGTFGYCRSLYSVILPSATEKIGIYAFIGCEELTNITLPDTVKEIGHEAFENCYALTKINLPDGLETIGVLAFYNAGLTEITIPATVADTPYTDDDGKPQTKNGIGLGAFHSCISLKKAVVNAQIKTLVAGVFGYCIALEEVYLPSTLTKIEGHRMNGDKLYIGHAFHNCAELKTVHFAGTQEQWTAITKENEEYKKDGATYNNNAIINVKKEYNSTYTA